MKLPGEAMVLSLGRLWIWLAESEKELGLEGITDEGIAQMKEHQVIQDDEFQIAKEEELRRRHLGYVGSLQQ